MIQPALIRVFLILGLIVIFLTCDPRLISAQTHVRGYYRKDGTYVRPYVRSSSGRSSSYRSSAPVSIASFQAPSRETEVDQSGHDRAEVFITKTGSKYHAAGCRHLSRSAIPIALEAAIKTYSPCSSCHPPTLIRTTESRSNARTTARTSARVSSPLTESDLTPLISTSQKEPLSREPEHERREQALLSEVNRLKSELEQKKTAHESEFIQQKKQEIARDEADEKRAEARLGMAKEYLKRPQFKEQGIQTLEMIVRDLPDTKAAQEALLMLKDLKPSE